ncbi:hypothetical protein Patl1_06781 [Pistacia atlantica]|uniref:Uncharacterized protein n=1 Tax=Pistacia atlantica TaxID=434234 RepID=A0ACC1BUS8_9ROSI|nr:hypothetical protein Patl1_06781 [Pistacia atlantica]
MSTESVRIFNFYPSTTIKHSSNLCPNYHHPPVYSFKLRQKQQQWKNGCVALGSDNKGEIDVMKVEEEEWLKIGRLRDKCKERKGMVELLECLETEAIMGDDEGKEPTDYNRRAQIFDKSSRVFQALKDHQS